MKDKLDRFFDDAVTFSLYGIILLLPFSIAAVEIFSISAIIFYIFKKIIHPEFKNLKANHNIFLFIFFGFMGLSLLNSRTYLYKSFDALVFKWSEYILIFLISSDTLNKKRVWVAVKIFFFSACVVCADVLSQRFLGNEFIKHRPLIVKAKLGYTAASGPFGHYNDLGSYLVFVFFLAFFALSLAKANIKKTLLWLLILLIFVSLYLTFSRGAWGSFFAVLFLVLIIKKRFRELVLVCVMFSAALIVDHDLRERILFTFTPHGDASRFVIWKAAWKMIAENPWLGKGLGTFMEYLPRYSGTAKIEYAHNSFLQIWAESGILSLLSFLSFIGVVLYGAISQTKRDDPVIQGLCLGITAYLIHAFFDTQLYSLQLAMLFWVALGMIVASSPVSNKTGQSKTS